jgi:hypothetical protein
MQDFPRHIKPASDRQRRDAYFCVKNAPSKTACDALRRLDDRFRFSSSSIRKQKAANLLHDCVQGRQQPFSEFWTEIEQKYSDYVQYGGECSGDYLLNLLERNASPSWRSKIETQRAILEDNLDAVIAKIIDILPVGLAPRSVVVRAGRRPMWTAVHRGSALLECLSTPSQKEKFSSARVPDAMADGRQSLASVPARRRQAQLRARHSLPMARSAMAGSHLHLYVPEGGKRSSELGTVCPWPVAPRQAVTCVCTCPKAASAAPSSAESAHGP